MMLMLAGFAALATPFDEARAAYDAKKYLTASHVLAELIPKLEGPARADAQVLLARSFRALAMEGAAVAVLVEAARAEPDQAVRAAFLDQLVELRAEDLGDLLAGAPGALPRAEAALVAAESPESLDVATSVGPTCVEASALQGTLLAARGASPEAAWSRECPSASSITGSGIAIDLDARRTTDLLIYRAEAGDLDGAEALADDVTETRERWRAEIALAAARWKAGDAKAGSSALKTAAKADHWVPEGLVLAAEVDAAGCTGKRDRRIADARALLALPDDDAAVQARLALDPEVWDRARQLSLVDVEDRMGSAMVPQWIDGPAGKWLTGAVAARRPVLEDQRDAAMERAEARLADLRASLGARLDAAEKASSACP